MVKIRLQRLGTKKRPFYRMVAADSRFPRNGRFLEILGTYSPLTSEPETQVTFKEGRVEHWLGQGAQPTDTVRALLQKGGLIAKETKQSKKK